MDILLEKACELPIPERIRLVEDIWDSIAAESGSVELTQGQMDELERRIEYHVANPEDTVPWEVVMDEALARK
ncbi:MAG: addiction module protein [Chloracidobacterium sp.]|nr:addiction module protein [Chloracidobacterium sp.]